MAFLKRWHRLSQKNIGIKILGAIIEIKEITVTGNTLVTKGNKIRR